MAKDRKNYLPNERRCGTMKTLDEVVKAMEICIRPDINRTCKDCPYPDDEMCMNELMADALQYLRWFQARDNMSRKLDREDNKPLTWDELKLMEGEPVWIELLYHHPEQEYKYWDIIKYFDMVEDYELIVLSKSGYLYKDLLGKEWKAYRRGKK